MQIFSKNCRLTKTDEIEEKYLIFRKKYVKTTKPSYLQILSFHVFQ